MSDIDNNKNENNNSAGLVLLLANAIGMTNVLKIYSGILFLISFVFFYSYFVCFSYLGQPQSSLLSFIFLYVLALTFQYYSINVYNNVKSGKYDDYGK